MFNKIMRPVIQLWYHVNPKILKCDTVINGMSTALLLPTIILVLQPDESGHATFIK